MLSFIGQGQLGKLGKLATFACQKRISENPNCLCANKYGIQMYLQITTFRRLEAFYYS